MPPIVSGTGYSSSLFSLFLGSEIFNIASSTWKFPIHGSSHPSQAPSVPGNPSHGYLNHIPVVLACVCTHRSQVWLQAHRTLCLRVSPWQKVLDPHTELSGSSVELCFWGSPQPRMDKTQSGDPFSFGTTEAHVT